MRENAAAKARRLLVEGRVMIIRVGQEGGVVAAVRGDNGVLREVTWDPQRGFRCTCPAIGVCSHAKAVASVVALPLTNGSWIDLPSMVGGAA